MLFRSVGTATTWQSVAGGYYHTVAVRTDGTLWAWGHNDLGQLGDGTTTTRSTPAQVGSATGWQGVAAGYFHALAVRTDGTLWAWGSDFFGQLGDGLPYYTATPLLIYPLTPTATRMSAPDLVLALVPNPAHEQVALPGWPAETQWSLVDAQGRRVRTGQGTRLSLQDVAPGLYLLRATRPGQRARTARLVRE